MKIVKEMTVIDENSQKQLAKMDVCLFDCIDNIMPTESTYVGGLNDLFSTDKNDDDLLNLDDMFKGWDDAAMSYTSETSRNSEESDDFPSSCDEDEEHEPSGDEGETNKAIEDINDNDSIFNLDTLYYMVDNNKEKPRTLSQNTSSSFSLLNSADNTVSNSIVTGNKRKISCVSSENTKKKKKKLSPEEKSALQHKRLLARRERKNNREKNRRVNIKQLYDDITDMLGLREECKKKKNVEKTAVLASTLAYIRALREYSKKKASGFPITSSQ